MKLQHFFDIYLSGEINVRNLSWTNIHSMVLIMLSANTIQ